jgi:molybdopterin-binding protein
MPHFRISEAAQLLSVSADTIRRWVDSGRLELAQSVGQGQGPQAVDGASLAQLAVDLAQEFRDERGSSVSARNRIVGIVTRVEIQGLAAIIEIQSGQNHIVSMITADSARLLELEVGSRAIASVKSTDVVIEKG